MKIVNDKKADLRSNLNLLIASKKHFEEVSKNSAKIETNQIKLAKENEDCGIIEIGQNLPLTQDPGTVTTVNQVKIDFEHSREELMIKNVRKL